MKLTIRSHIPLALAGREKCISVMNSIGIALALAWESGIHCAYYKQSPSNPSRRLPAALLAGAYPANHEGDRKTIHFSGIVY
jgi:hypothetical protein